MRPLHILTALAALYGFGSSGSIIVGMPDVKPPPPSPLLFATQGERIARRRRMGNGGIALGRVGGNQRQIPKDRRRAHAAGVKNAFR